MTDIDNTRSSTTCRLDADLRGRLDQAAAERGVTLNWIINKLLTESLDRLLPVDELRLTRPPMTRLTATEKS